MKFIISKEYQYCECSPHIKATKEQLYIREVRTCNTFKEFDNKHSNREGSWLSKGKNHCINSQGNITRDMYHTESFWTIEITTMQELLALSGYTIEVSPWTDNSGISPNQIDGWIELKEE